MKLQVCHLSVAALLAVSLPASAQQPAPSSTSILADGANAKPLHVDNLHEVRYIEIFLAHRDPKTGSLVAGCYNTMFTPAGIPGSRDTAPQALVAALDFDKIKKKYNLLGASLNGPKLWMTDWSEVRAGVVRDFGGIKAAWVGQLNMGDIKGGVDGATPYKPQTIARKSALGWNMGTKVMLIDDADGHTWILKGFQVGLKPKQTYEDFLAAGEGQFKKLPPGWKVRIVTLKKDLIEKPKGGVATIMPDEFFNVYDKTGPGMTNNKP